MEFVIKRVSTSWNNGEPCPGAIRHEVPALPDDWREDEERVYWTIEVGTLEDLLALIAKHGQVVVTLDLDYEMPHGAPKHERMIEIYDSYRE